MNGIINVYKEPGYTSFDVVAKLRGILKTRKIGHAGTLDPAAEGVLPVAIGKATRLCDMLTDKTKVYEADLLLGVATDTLDMEGKILKELPVACSETEAADCIRSFIGEQEQLPPMYSAVKVNGKRLYELAREGRTAERKARRIFIYEIEILNMALPRIKIKIKCSKGTYIRSLCDDIGRALGCGGCMEHLVRTASGGFEIKDALKLIDIEILMKEGRIGEILLPVEEILGEYPKVKCAPRADKAAHNGNRIFAADLTEEAGLRDGEAIRLYDSENNFIGIFEYNAVREYIKPLKMLKT